MIDPEPLPHTPPSATALAAYIAFWEDIGPTSAARLDAVMTPDIRFTDPFNRLHGHAAVRRLLDDMFARCEAPRFTVHDRAQGSRAVYLRWCFQFRSRGRARSWRIEGMSEIAFAADGRALSHTDHWDAAGQLYGTIPGLGWLMRRLRRALSVEPPGKPSPGA